MPTRAKQLFCLGTTLALGLVAASCSNPSSTTNAYNAESANGTANTMASNAGGGAAAGASTDSFVRDAAIGGQYEIQAADLALQRTRDPRVRALARMIRSDHEKAAHELDRAAKGGPTPPPTALDSQHQQMLDELRNARPQEFDEIYLNQQKTAHDQAVQAFSDYASNGDNPALKRFAADTLPALRKHDDAVAKAQSEMGSGPTANTSGTSSTQGR